MIQYYHCCYCSHCPLEFSLLKSMHVMAYRPFFHYVPQEKRLTRKYYGHWWYIVVTKCTYGLHNESLQFLLSSLPIHSFIWQDSSNLRTYYIDEQISIICL